MSNQNTTSGISAISNEPLSGLDGYYAWGPEPAPSHYTRVSWSPSSTIDEGNPTTYTLSASYDGFGASVQETQYPESLSPIFPTGTENAAFGSTWSGSNVGDYVAANSVALVNMANGSEPNTYPYVGFSY